MFHLLGNCIFGVYVIWRCFNGGVVVINFFLPVATRKLNGLIGRNDFVEIIDVVDLKIKIEFKDKYCVIDNYGKAEWSDK